jgi:Adenylate and Guanylate cyclase catalytic domain
LPPGRRMRFRIGVHLGDVMVGEDDLFGDAVNIAARLQALAEPGGICVSAALRQHAGSRIPAAFSDWGRSKSRTSPKPSVAVLPFTNMSADPEQEFFADGISEDVITALSRFPSLSRPRSRRPAGRSGQIPIMRTPTAGSRQRSANLVGSPKRRKRWRRPSRSCPARSTRMSADAYPASAGRPRPHARRLAQSRLAGVMRAHGYSAAIVSPFRRQVASSSQLSASMNSAQRR